jgi:hypothetical protein
MARDLRCRPSDLYDIRGSHRRYCFDSAVWTFGSALSAELEGAKGKTEQQQEMNRLRILRRWIPEMNDAKGQFRDPGG